MTITAEDMARLVGDLRATADLLASDGLAALDVMAGWTTGPRSAVTEPSGHVYESCSDPLCEEGGDHFHAKAADPTGEAVLVEDRAAEMHGDYVGALRSLSIELLRTKTFVKVARPQATGVRDVVHETAAAVSAAGYCVSCHRDAQHCTPVAAGRYSDLCRWCGDFRGANVAVLGAQGLPPIELVRARHRGERLTERMVTRALAAHVSRATPKKKRGRR